MTIYDQLRRDEDVRYEMYMDTQGHLTIGVGHNLRARPLSERAVQTILEDDVAATRSELEVSYPWIKELSEPRQGVLMNMAFNLGVPGLGEFQRMFKALQQRGWMIAASELLDSRYAKQVGDRAKRLAQQIVDDRWI